MGGDRNYNLFRQFLGTLKAHYDLTPGRISSTVPVYNVTEGANGQAVIRNQFPTWNGDTLQKEVFL